MTPDAVTRRDRRLLRRALVINFASLLGKGFWPLLIWLVPGWHGAQALGRFMLVYAAVEVLQALCSTGFVDGLYRQVARLPEEPLGDDDYASLRLALGAVLALGAAATLAAWVGGDLLVRWLWHRPDLEPALQTMAAAIPLAGATAVLVAAGTAMMRNEGEALVRSVLVPGLTLALAWRWRGDDDGAQALARSYLLAQAAGLGAALLWFSRLGALRRLWPGARHGRGLIDARAQLRFGLLQGLNVMMWVGVYSVDTLLLGAFVRDTQIALYRAGSELARTLQYFRTQFSAAFAPLAGRYLRHGELARLQALLRSLSVTMMDYAVLLAGLLAHLADPILRAMLPSQVAGERGFLLVLLMGHLVVAALALAGNTLVVAGQQRAILTTSLAMTVVNVIAGAVLIPALGLTGAATATLAAMTVAMVSQAFALRATLRIRVAWRPLVASLALGVAGYAASWSLVMALRRLDLATSRWACAAIGAVTFTALVGARHAVAALRAPATSAGR